MSPEKIKRSSNRSFGIVFFFFFLIISIYPLLHEENIILWAFFLAFLFLALGLLNSKILSPLNLIWFKFGIILGRFISPIIMGIIFFGIVTPTSIIMKILNKDILKLKKNNKKTYWIPRQKNNTSMKNQF
jgi:polyferredoxin